MVALSVSKLTMNWAIDRNRDLVKVYTSVDSESDFNWVCDSNAFNAVDNDVRFGHVDHRQRCPYVSVDVPVAQIVSISIVNAFQVNLVVFRSKFKDLPTSKFFLLYLFRVICFYQVNSSPDVTHIFFHEVSIKLVSGRGTIFKSSFPFKVPARAIRPVLKTTVYPVDSASHITESILLDRVWSWNQFNIVAGCL